MGAGRGGHRHLQIGRMLDIDLISEHPHAPSPRCMYPKCGNLCGQRGRKRFIASWGLRMSHNCPCTPCPSPQGSKVVILPTTGGRGAGMAIFHLYLKAVLGMYLQYVRDNWLHHQLAKKSTILARYLSAICMAGKGFTFIS